MNEHYLRTLINGSVFLFLVGMIFSLESCQNQNNGVAPINPNGDSELALMMRDMFEEAMAMKKEIDQGEKPKAIKRFEAMHTAEATEPEKVAMPIYATFTDAYLESLNALKNASIDETPKAFNGVVQSCMNCHQAMCPGPIVRIEKLWVDK